MDHPLTLKRCSRCGEDKPEDDFYVKIPATGRRFTWCKPCHVKRTTADYHRRKAGLPPPPRPAPPVLTERECRRCGIIKPIDAFRTHRRDCRDCERELASIERQEYPERQQQRWARYSAKSRSRLNDAARERYAIQPGAGAERQREWRAANPERARAAVRRWKEKNPGYNAVFVARRRARLLGALGTITAAQWAELKAFYGERCLRCGRSEPEIALTIDHVRPLVLGGTHKVDNAQVLCQPCNSWKYVYEIDFRGDLFMN